MSATCRPEKSNRPGILRFGRAPPMRRHLLFCPSFTTLETGSQETASSVFQSAGFLNSRSIDQHPRVSGASLTAAPPESVIAGPHRARNAPPFSVGDCGGGISEPGRAAGASKQGRLVRLPDAGIPPWDQESWVRRGRAIRQENVGSLPTSRYTSPRSPSPSSRSSADSSPSTIGQNSRSANSPRKLQWPGN